MKASRACYVIIATMENFITKFKRRLLIFGPVERLVSRVKRYCIFLTQNSKKNLLKWHMVRSCPLKLYDSGGAQVGHLLYVICGYSHQDEVHNSIEVLDLKSNRWKERIKTPDDMAQSHLAISTDGKRFIYIVSGQLGSQCSPAIRNGFIYDTKDKMWQNLPLLPEARYAATMQLWNGRLHIVGGSKEDRFAPSCDHWSLAVNGGKAIEQHWKVELPIPLGGCHRGSAIIDNAFYVFGSQQGDFTAIPGDPIYTCTHKTVEHYSTQVYVLNQGGRKWERMPDMPVSSTHTDYSVEIVGKKAILVGGQVYKDPFNFSLKLTDCVQSYDSENKTWKIIGHYPYRVKTLVTAYYDGWLYAVTGQRDTALYNASPLKVVNYAWRTKLDQKS